MRDRALLLVGFACALRCSELANTYIEHLQSSENGFKLNISWSKTSKRNPMIPFTSNSSTCPLRVRKNWIQISGITQGALFRSINRHGKIQDKELSDKFVEIISIRHFSTQMFCSTL